MGAELQCDRGQSRDRRPCGLQSVPSSFSPHSTLSLRPRALWLHTLPHPTPVCAVALWPLLLPFLCARLPKGGCTSSHPVCEQVPTFRANGRTSALNVLAGQLGDDRAAGVRRKYGRPFKAVVILGTGVLPV